MRSQSPRCAIRRWPCGASRHWPQPGLALKKREAGEKGTQGYSRTEWKGKKSGSFPLLMQGSVLPGEGRAKPGSNTSPSYINV